MELTFADVPAARETADPDVVLLDPARRRRTALPAQRAGVVAAGLSVSRTGK